MTEPLLDLNPGEKLQLQLLATGHEERYATTLIGYLHGKSLLITTPEVEGRVLWIREGQLLALRTLHGTEARGFMGRVLAVVSRPYPHLHLSCPERIEAAVVRNAERVDTRVLTLVRNATQGEQKWHPGVIRDVSNTGALLHTVNPLGRMGDELDLRFNLDVCGRQEVLDRKAVLRNQANALATEIDPEYQTRLKTGIEWRVANRYQEVLLSNYLLMAKGAGESAQPTRPGDRG